VSRVIAAMRTLALAAVAAGCVPPDTAPPPPPAEVAIVRVAEGDSLSGIAHRLHVPGGWRALAAVNQLPDDRIRAGAGLRVPVDYLRERGIDPYGELGLEPLIPALPARPLVACPSELVDGGCATVGDATACVDDGAVTVERGGVTTSDPLPEDAGGGFELRRVDLDGDRRDELVIVVPLQSWGHLSLQRSRVVIVGAAGTTQLDVEQWGEGSLVQGDRGCDLLVTSWDDLHHPFEPDGTYLVGRQMRYAHGELVPIGDEVVRRMRSRFWLRDDDTSRPAEWLSAPDAEWWPELGPSQRTRDRHHGTIATIASDADGLVVEVALDDGRRVTYRAGATGCADDPYELLDNVGSTTTGMLMPEAYVPADPARWLGREVIVSDDSDYAAGDPPGDPSDDPGSVCTSHAMWVAGQ